jgi:hypothetical protein
VWQDVLRFGGVGALATVLVFGVRQVTVSAVVVWSMRKNATGVERKHAITLLRVLGAGKRVTVRRASESEP